MKTHCSEKKPGFFSRFFFEFNKLVTKSTSRKNIDFLKTIFSRFAELFTLMALTDYSNLLNVITPAPTL
jgi:hypothetical protein